MSVILKIITLVCTVGFLFLYNMTQLGPFSIYIYDIGLISVLIGLTLFLKCSQERSLAGNWLKPSYIFVIALLAVNFQTITDLRFGYKDVSSFLITHSNTLNIAGILGVISLLSFVLGYSLFKNKHRKKQHVRKFNLKIRCSTYFFVCLQVLLFILFIATIDVQSFLLGDAYVGGNDKETVLSDYFETMLFTANVLLVVSVIQKKSSQISLKSYLKKFPIISIIVFSLYLLLRLVSGDRGPFIYNILLIVFGYLYFSKKQVHLVTMLSLLFAGAIFISIIGIARNLESTSGTFGDRFNTALNQFSTNGRFGDIEDNTISPMTEEFEYSFYPIQVDVEAIETGEAGIRHGRYQLISIINSIPFASGLITNVLNVSPEDRSSSGFANYYFFGGYDRNYGIGTSCVGDFYLDFGVLGVLIGFFIIGCFYKYIDLCYCKTSFALSSLQLIVLLLYSAHAIYIPRSIFLGDVKQIVWGVIFVIIGNLIAARK